jgi:hypothetical protein
MLTPLHKTQRYLILRINIVPKSEIIKAQALKSIRYADKPLGLGGVVQSLSVAQFQDKFGLSYGEGLRGDPDALREYLSD